MKRAIILLVIVSVFVSATVYDEDTAGATWNGTSPSDGDNLIKGGWSITEGSDNYVYTQDAGNDYDGDNFYITPSAATSPRYDYTNASVDSKYLTFHFYDDSADTAAYTYVATSGQNMALGLHTSTTTANYVCYDGVASFQDTGISRTTGWHNFTFKFNYSTTNLTGFIDGQEISGSCSRTESGWTGITNAHLFTNTDCLNCRIDKINFWNETGSLPPLAPALSAFNCTSCNIPQGDNVSPYTTADTTPTFTLGTNFSANCRIGDVNQTYTTMGSSRNCGTTGSTTHTCSLIAQDELATSTDYVYVSCANAQNDSLSNTAQLQMNITNLQTNTTNAIDRGIQESAIWPGAKVYSNQQIYLRNLDNIQVLATVDRVAVFGNQRWIFNAGIDDETALGLFNLTPVVYVLDMVNVSLGDIQSQVSALIDATKN